MRGCGTRPPRSGPVPVHVEDGVLVADPGYDRG
jgi:hypothetical protein